MNGQSKFERRRMELRRYKQTKPNINKNHRIMLVVNTRGISTRQDGNVACNVFGCLQHVVLIYTQQN